MIKKIMIENKKGDQIELDFEEIQKLKDQLNELDQVQPSPYPIYYPIHPTTANGPFWQIPPVTCTGDKT